MLAQSRRNTLTTLDIHRGGFYRLLHDYVTHGLGYDLQHLQDGNTATDEGGQRAGEPGQTEFVSQRAENGKFNPAGIPELPSRRGLDKIEPAVNSRAARYQQEEEVTLHDGADVDQVLSGGGQLSTEAGKDFAENGD